MDNIKKRVLWIDLLKAISRLFVHQVTHLIIREALVNFL